MEEYGWLDVTRVEVDPQSGLVDPQAIAKAIRPDTKLIAITHASNVTGTVQPIREIAQIARKHGIPLIVDAAQSAGHIPIDLRADGIDLLAAPGHKGLLGPLGTGFLYIRPGLETVLRPLKEGARVRSVRPIASPISCPIGLKREATMRSASPGCRRG